MRTSPALGGLLLGCTVVSAGTAAETTEAPGFDYLYIVANEGGSSGGHTAIRFGPDVYHFQNEDDLLVLQRDRVDEFLYSYALLGNRTIHSTRVAVSDETLSGLVDRFRQRHRAQQAQLDVAGALRRDRVLLEFLADREDGSSTRAPALLLSIAGLGYFESDPPTAGRRSATLDSLRQEIVRTHGPEFLANRRRAVAQEMRTLLQEDPAAWSVEYPSSVNDHPPFARSYSSRWVDLRAGRAALDVIEEARALAGASRHAPDDDTFSLTVEEVAALERYATKLAGQLVEVSNSRRADWGQTLLVGMARLLALNQSIASRSLVFLDTFPDGPAGVTTVTPQRRGGFTSAMLSENLVQFEASRAHFRSCADPDELAWERLEERSNRYFEMLRAERNGGEIRVARGHLVPSRMGLYPIANSPPVPARVALSEAAKRALERERAYSREMRRLHSYELITRNCATAIFETLNTSFDGSVEISQSRLGGHVGGPNSLAFIPFVSAQQVNQRYRVTRQETILSYRHHRLRAMRERESPVRVALRESNTFTARSYQRHPDDSFFVFFTDESPLLRPLFGAINLIAAVGETVVGIVMAPVDRGAGLLRGLRGSFVSLPELAFVNIRKGSNDWIPTEHRDLDSVVVMTELRPAARESSETYDRPRFE